MAKTRKTFEVDVLRNKINKMLTNSHWMRDHRQIAMVILEDVLHETGNYNGFRYLTAGEIQWCDHPENCKPGINFTDRQTYASEMQLTDEEAYEHQFANTDRTRVKYY